MQPVSPDMVWTGHWQIFMVPLNLAVNQETVSLARYKLFYYSTWRFNMGKIDNDLKNRAKSDQ